MSGLLLVITLLGYFPSPDRVLDDAMQGFRSGPWRARTLLLTNEAGEERRLSGDSSGVLGAWFTLVSTGKIAKLPAGCGVPKEGKVTVKVS